MQTTPATDQPTTSQTPNEQQLKRTLAANLAAIERERPDLAPRLYAALEHDDGRFEIRSDPKGGWTVFQRFDNNRAASLSPLQNNVNTLDDLFRSALHHFREQSSVVLLGAGDGRMLRWLADHPPKKFMDAELCVYFIEPDPNRLLRALMLHDFSNENGPIAAQRFRWYVGEDWADQMRGELDECPRLPQPKVFLGMTSLQKSAQQAVERIYSELNGRAAQRLDAVTKWADARSDADLAALFSDDPPRQPRVLLMTSRLTTVLQYSTGDLADAFEQLGWDATVSVEQRPFEKHTFASLVDAIDSVRPDCIVALNHLRQEVPFLPESIPHICWIQDHMPNLTTSEAGRKIDARQFVLTAQKFKYVDEHDYPATQCIEVGKLTRPAQLPARWARDGDDIVYVSHAPDLPDERMQQILTHCRTDAERQCVERACKAMIDAYARDAQTVDSKASMLSLQTRRQVREFLAGVDPAGWRAIEPSRVREFVNLIFDHLNNQLYRRQALHWVKRVAAQRGLTLAIYGEGWHRDPQFAPHARGPVQYGSELEDVTRRARINLQIVPFICLHQRLLDGIAAGGFFLIRQHPGDQLIPELCSYLETYCDEDVMTTQQARQAIPPAKQSSFDALMQRAAVLADDADPITLARTRQRTYFARGDRPLLPRLEETSFHDASSFETRLDELLDDPTRRDDIAREQRRYVLDHFTYAGTLRRVTREMHNLLAGDRDRPVDTDVEAPSPQ